MKTLSIALVTLLLGAVAADASTFSTSPVPLYSGKYQSGRSWEVVWTAEPGDRIDGELRIEADGFVAVRDRNAAVVPGDRCSAGTDGWLRCPVPRWDPLQLRVRLGDGDDALRITDLRGRGHADDLVQFDGAGGSDRIEVAYDSSARLPLQLNGGDGDDTLVGGPGDDMLSDGRGSDKVFGGGGNDRLVTTLGDESAATADVLDGGAGTDVVFYAYSPLGVAVDLAAGTGGFGGEDRIERVEQVVGSRHADVLRGDDAANVLDGNGGLDVLDGRGGDDLLKSGVQGPGDPSAMVAAVAAPTRCGAGADRVIGPWAAGESTTVAWPARDCEQFVTAPYSFGRFVAGPRSVRLSVRATYTVKSKICGLSARLRTRDGKTIASRQVRIYERERRTVALRSRRRLPAGAAVELTFNRCTKLRQFTRSPLQPVVVVPLPRR
jgi:Ca2+-binding RTX toxin-like protein